MSSKNIIETKALSKDFFGVKALIDVNLTVEEGEILAIVGENGAGKSTLVRILSGIIPKGSYTGNFTINGTVATYNNPKDAQNAGIAIIHQELMLIRDITVAENIFLGRWPLKNNIVDWNTMHENAKKILSKLGQEIDTHLLVKELGISYMQLIEIGQALSQNSRVLILDEPTAALTEVEARRLFDLIRNLQKRGVTIIYISHRLKEVLGLADRIAVLRDGKLVGVEKARNLTYHKIVSMMIGRELANLFPREIISAGEIALQVRNFSVDNTDIKGQKKIKNIFFTLHKGEILGISGLLGAGRTELAMSLFGDNSWPHSGEVIIDGKQVLIKNPADAIRHGIALLTEDRHRFGLIPQFSISKNITLAILRQISNSGFINSRRESSIVDDQMNRLRIKTTSPSTLITSLSGGNQQKVLVARWLASAPRILIMDEPTRGIDVETKAEIYHLMRELTKHNIAIMMISSDLMEILEISDRILVMYEGSLTGEFRHDQATEETIMACATGTENRPSKHINA